MSVYSRPRLCAQTNVTLVAICPTMGHNRTGLYNERAHTSHPFILAFIQRTCGPREPLTTLIISPCLSIVSQLNRTSQRLSSDNLCCLLPYQASSILQMSSNSNASSVQSPATGLLGCTVNIIIMWQTFFRRRTKNQQKN